MAQHVTGRPGRLRWAALLVLLALAAACGPRPGAPDPAPVAGDPTAPVDGVAEAEPGGDGSDGGAAVPADGASPAPGSAPVPDGAPGDGPPGSPGPPPEDGVPEAVPPPTGPGGAPAAPAPPQPAPAGAALPPLDGPLGSLCRTYLQPGPSRIVVEVDAQAGAEVPAGVLGHLREQVAAVVSAPVEVVDGGGVPGGGEPWTLDRVRQVAAATRDVGHGADTAVIHLLSLAGQPDQSAPPSGQADIRDAIGVAFAAGEFVVFPDRVDGLAVLLGGAEAVLRAVVVHELGHLLCLVNLSYTSEIDHEDPAHPAHSADRGSVMFHAIETTAVGQLFSGPPPDRFAAADLADLDGLRTGRY